MSYLKGLTYWVLAFLMLAALALPGNLKAQGNFVYTNDDIAGANTVSGFSVASNGKLTLVPGSPFLTGGTGKGGGYYASNRAAVSTVGTFLFASNGASGNVSVFTINTRTGALKLVEGSPFATQAIKAGDIALSPTPNGMFLMAAISGSSRVTVFRIASSGALTPIKGSPFATLGDPDGIKVSPNGKFLAVVLADKNQVEIFGIASNGSLTSLGTAPGAGAGGVAGVDIKCSSKLLYAGEAASYTTVDAFAISYKGALTTVPGSPFEPGVGENSNVVLLGYIPGDHRIFVDNQNLLFVSNQASGTITVFSVDSDGSLTLVAGSPFPMNSGAHEPAGMATSADGRLLYVANDSNRVSVFSVAKSGALTEVAGSPFPTGQPGSLLSITSYPQRAIPWIFSYFGLCPWVAMSSFRPQVPAPEPRLH